MMNQQQREEISAAVAALLAEADRDIAARRPICRASGRCCQFETYGHRLYVTAAELVHFAHHHAALPGAPQQPSSPARPRFSLAQWSSEEKHAGCPYQIGGLCTAREGRPLGCRVYFCDKNAQSWQAEVYEKYHAQLRALHERLDLPYRYLEWRAGLHELAAQNPAG